VRTSERPRLRNGEAISVDLAPEDISIWPSTEEVSAELLAR
jgi:hypothetical protein